MQITFLTKSALGNDEEFEKYKAMLLANNPEKKPFSEISKEIKSEEELVKEVNDCTEPLP